MNTSAAVAPVADSTVISFQEIQQMQSRGQTLDGVFNSTEEWLIRAEKILLDAERIRKHIEVLRKEREIRSAPTDSTRVDDTVDSVSEPKH
ncbi:MAG: hypothetical protein H7X80_06105 [bacterium]|nr:hypothetical protein [Candidatus Kapabacteria bacterium]